MMHRQKVKLLLWVAALLSVLALVVVPALAKEISHTLTVEKAGAGTGTVTSDDGGINCGTDCDELYEPDTLVTLTATPDEDSVFANWSGGCVQRLKLGYPPTDPTEPVITFPMGQEDMTCTANFGLPVGGIAVPVSRLGLLAPWIGLAALVSLAALTVAVVRRRRG
jgi:hypothetical protein